MSKQKVGTREFAQAVVARLGKKPETLKEAKYAAIAERKSWVRDPARYPEENGTGRGGSVLAQATRAALRSSAMR